MTTELLLAFAVFAFVTSVTPGPNNVMLLASGLNHGLARTVPHILGINAGCVVMLVLAGAGLGELLVASPRLYAVLRYAAAAYLLYLAWKIARSGMLRPADARGRPMGVLAAAAFQWVNPKAWVMVLGAVTTYAPADHFMRNVCVLAVILSLVNAPSLVLWAGFGVGLRRILGHPARVRWFNITMAALLVLSLYPILMH
jgi:threonine/homoserine/homoserine lactone efflux protein